MTTAVEFIEPMGDADGAARAAALFEARFGMAPAGVWAAPGRVNLIGEHTDYNGGLCLPIALPHRTYVALAPREDTTVRVISDMTPSEMTMADLDGLGAGGVDGWGAYPIGVAWALREAGFDEVRGFDAVFSSCVPLGSGLSSSAAMTCSTALALDDVYGLGFGGSDEGRITLIDAAVMAENEMAGASTGGLDQNASMRCTADHAIRLDCMPGLTAAESVRQEPFDLSAYGLELLVLDTQAPHQLNDGQYEARRTMCEEAARILGVPNLRMAADQVNAAADPAAALEDVLGRLDDDLRVKLQFVTGNIADQYIGIRAQVINRTEGQVDSQVFRFSDILGPDPILKNRGSSSEIHIWVDYGKADWYGYHPSPAAMEKVADTINEYLSLYQSEDMNLGGQIL